MKAKYSYEITYLNKDGDVIDETSVDELNDELIWDLFKEFGHEKLEGMYYESNKIINV